MGEKIKCEKLFQRIEELEKEYIDFWVDVCNIESPTEYKEGVDRVGNFIAEKARRRGWKIEVQEQPISGNCICITMNPDAKAQPVCFSGHMDTVHPIGSFGEVPVHCDKEKIYGPGVCDCKGGIVSSFLAMAALEDIGFKERPVKLLLQSDEETSSRASNKSTVDFMCKKAENCIAFLNAEGFKSGSAIYTRKGISRYSFEITGKSIHASNCPDGISAIREAAYKIIELEKMKDAEGITCSCGLISGGTAENTVPEKCTFTADIRFNNKEEMQEAEKIVNKIAAKSYVSGSLCKVTLKSRRIAMELTERNVALLEKLNTIYEQNHLPVLKGKKSAGGSDAAEITDYGHPCLDSLGVEGGNIHTPDEYAYLRSLTYSAKMLAAAAYCL